MTKLKIIFIILIMFFVSCSTEKEVQAEKSINGKDTSPELSINLNKVSSWINLMPGPDAEPTFHISGEIELLKSADYDYKQLVLTNIYVYQNDERVYTIKPEVRINTKLSTDEMNYIIFTSSRGLTVKNNLNTEKPVEAKLIFEDDSNIFSYYIKDVKIDKAY